MIEFKTTVCYDVFMTMRGKKVLISGGSSGIGAAIIRKLVDEGATVYSIDINKPSESIDGVTYLTADLSKLREITSALTAVDGIDLLRCHAAGHDI